MRRPFLFMFLLLASLPVTVLAKDPVPAPASSISTEDHGDPVLKAMLAELRRSQEKLQLGQLQRPYYIDYQVTEMQSCGMDAILGALTSNLTSVNRWARVVVRIGDYQQDSYFGQGTGSVGVMPIDNNELVLRHQLWLATDQAYKSALKGLTEKQAALKNVEADQSLADFSQEKPAQSVGGLAKLDLNMEAWKQQLRSTSNLFRRDPSLEASSAYLRCRVLNRYYVNTEGTVMRSGNALYAYGFAGDAQAPDGMRLDRSHGYVVTRPEELPNPLQIKKDTERLIGSFGMLSQAPLVEEDYRGPVLFSADAATALFESLVLPNIAGVRPALGNPARTRGKFNSYYRSRVLPSFMTVVDDPQVRKLDGLTLAGSYAIDDEGVPAQAVTVIDKGVLTNYLLDREPIRDFPHSNGHGRVMPTGGPPRPLISNLIVQASNSVSLEMLQAKLLQMCKDQGRPYGYYVETTGPQLAPRLLWRIYASDGHMELVRGAVFRELDTQALRNDIIAAGNDRYVYNRFSPIASSIVAPSLLFDELDIGRANRTREKLPDYQAPPLSPN